MCELEGVSQAWSTANQIREPYSCIFSRRAQLLKFLTLVRTVLRTCHFICLAMNVDMSSALSANISFFLASLLYHLCFSIFPKRPPVLTMGSFSHVEISYLFVWWLFNQWSSHVNGALDQPLVPANVSGQSKICCRRQQER